MKTESSELIHKMNNQLGGLISSLEAMEANIENPDYCKEVVSEIIAQKNDFRKTVDECINFLIGATA